MSGNPEKANHYFTLLDAARVNASWAEVPELVRKVNKHAPHRKVLVHTATAEHDVATSNPAGSPRSSTPTKPAPIAALSSILQSGGDEDAEFFFQGKACLLWARWVGLEGNSATAGFDTAAAVQELEGQHMSTWTRICIVKSAYMEGTNYMQNGRPTEAQKTFNVAISNMQTQQELVLSTPQLAYWAEQLLAQAAVGPTRPENTRVIDPHRREIFRHWAAITSKIKEVPASTYRNSASHLSRLSVWRKYFNFVSTDLEGQSAGRASPGKTSRLDQATELRKVERAYENELLRVTKFPKATEGNASVEQWVEQAVKNWQILCGPRWQDSDLGEGGRNAVARNMLDILYRAATKTFHSTLILRRLFQVHKSLSEFELAFRAFDTYLELVERGRVRVSKSTTPEPGQEADETVLVTLAEAVSALCTFGGRAEARKAYDLCLKLENWLVTIGVNTDDFDGTPGMAQNGQLPSEATPSAVSSTTLQIVYRAIGCARAHWARSTPISEDRSALQQQALTSLRRACSTGTPEIDTLYALAVLMAETRDISGAIDYAKRALTKGTSANLELPTWAMERKLISLWHLLALLLSSRQDFDNAATSCSAAFEQYVPNYIPTKSQRNSSVISASAEKQILGQCLDQLECADLQDVVELKITELALTELSDGPEEAVNNSNELLSLFSRLFAHIQIPLETPAATRNLVPPKSSAGTVKSARTSIFRRKRDSHLPEPLKEKSDEASSRMTDNARPSTRATQAPTIEVTNDEETSAHKKRHFRRSLESSRSKHSADKGPWRSSNRQSVLSEGDSVNHSSENVTGPDHASNAPVGALQTVPDDRVLPTPNISQDHSTSTESKQELPTVGHNLASHTSVPPPATHDAQPPHQDVRLPTVNDSTNATSPTTRFPKAASQRQALSLLAKIWLIIATLYRRASMFEDSREACEEAGKAAGKIESLAGAVDHSARAFAEAGWGPGNKSADEVWADVYCARAELSLAIHNRKVLENKMTDSEELQTAVEQFEQCLMFSPDHAGGVIGLSNLLLDFYEKKVDLGRRTTENKMLFLRDDTIQESISPSPNGNVNQVVNGTAEPRVTSTAAPSNTREATIGLGGEEDLKKTPENLNRIAARDRAYGLLSTLTKLASGWDNSEAWYALARAHELGGELDRARSILWWCVELEDTKPIRHWRNLGYGVS